MKSTDAAALANVRLIDHPLVQHKLTLMRRRDTPFAQFRRLLSEIASLMIYEVCRDMPLQDVEIETPLERMRAPVIDGKQLVFASILRAGEGLLEGALGVVPSARVCHIGLYREPNTLRAVEYYFRVPAHLEASDVVVLDPMMATGGTAVTAVTRLKTYHPKSVTFVCALTCPEGVHALHAAHPDVRVFTAAIDRELNSHGYIVPGLGDAGDRIFGTN
jgi:uracil phosphoribosyltransferase